MSEILTVIISLMPVLVILFVFTILMRLCNSMYIEGRSRGGDGERHRRTSLLTGRTKWDEEDEDDEEWVSFANIDDDWDDDDEF